MTVFVDTSGIIALIDRDDPAHAVTRQAFAMGRDEPLSTHAYVVVETLAVVRRRLGSAIAADIVDRVLPAIEVAVVDEDLHAASLVAYRQNIASPVSLVDRTSFAFMHRHGIRRAIALDADFTAAGFETIP